MEYLERIAFAKMDPGCAKLMFSLGYDVDEFDKGTPDFYRAMVTIKWYYNMQQQLLAAGVSQQHKPSVKTTGQVSDSAKIENRHAGGHSPLA